MNFEQITEYRMESPEGYIVSRSRHGDGFIFVARAPRVVGYLYTGMSSDKAEAACRQHLQQHELVEVRTIDLRRPALNWAVAVVLGLKVSVGADGEGKPACMLGDPRRVYDPAGDWEQGGALLDKFCIADASDLAAACRSVVGMLGGNVWKVPAALVQGDGL